MSRIRRCDITILVLAVVGVMGAGCGSASPSGSRPASPAGGWVDEPVTYTAGGVTIYATFRHPNVQGRDVPAALLIAGSGPTDRNGNSALLPGPVDTLKTVADWLSADGVASLRYDKLGSGQTGLGRYAADPQSIGIDPFEQEATAALSFLARQHGVDRNRLAVIGHSEGSSVCAAPRDRQRGARAARACSRASRTAQPPLPRPDRQADSGPGCSRPARGSDHIEGRSQPRAPARVCDRITAHGAQGAAEPALWAGDCAESIDGSVPLASGSP